jgi:hypothetical protein
MNGESETESEYVLNMTVFPVVLPVIVFVLLVVFKKLQS